jgi:hypothetical protein
MRLRKLLPVSVSDQQVIGLAAAEAFGAAAAVVCGIAGAGCALAG